MAITMKKVLLIGTAALLTVLTALLLVWLREPDDPSGAADMFVMPEAAKLAVGPAIGSRFPGLRAFHGDRSVTLLENFAGPNGTLLVALQSLDWCQFCKRQMLQLQEYAPFFRAAGIGLVAISYDSPELIQTFVKNHEISVPVLADDDALTFRTLGILDKRYPPGDERYGLPHPGMIIVDSDGIVAGKLFVENDTRRVDSAAALAFARQELGLRPPIGRG